MFADGSLPANAASSKRVAHAFSRALANPARRSDLLEALRASPYNEHKLVLQEFVATPAGQTLVAEAASVAKLTPAELATMIAELPTLDLYVPSRAQRETWRGDEKIIVAIEMGGSRARLSGFDTNGRGAERRFGGSDHPGNGPVVILMHHAEPKGVRAAGRSTGAGNVIQDANEEDLAVQTVDYLANGDSVVTHLVRGADGSWRSLSLDGQMASFDANCDPNTSIQECDSNYSGGSNPPPPSAVTRLVYLSTHNVCDNYNCAEGNEFEFRAYERNASGVTLSNRTLRVEGIAYAARYNLDLPNIFRVANGDGRSIKINVFETDAGWPNPDDQFGPSPVFRYIGDQNPIYNVGASREPFWCQYEVMPPNGQCTEVHAKWEWP